MKSVEALLCLLALLLLLGTLTAICSRLKSAAQTWVNHYNAAIEAEKCASIIESLYSNGSSLLRNADVNCSASEKGEVTAFWEGEKAMAALFNSSAVSSAASGGEINVRVSPHYE